MRTLQLFIVFILALFGCNNANQKVEHSQSLNNIDYADQGLELKEGSKITKFTLEEINIQSDTIKINYTDSLRWFDFHVVSLRDSTWCQFVQKFSITDSSYRKPMYRIIEKDIYLESIGKGSDSKLTGKIKAIIERHYTWTQYFNDTIIITGSLNTRLD